MHEATVAQSLLTTILAEAVKQNAKPVSADISCGVLNPVNDEVLTFAFESLAEGTACQGMKLNIEHKPIRGKCRACGQTFDVDFRNPICPACGSGDFELLPDAPLLLESIEFETE